MALNFSSPAVIVQEVDRTQIIRTNGSKVAVIVLAAETGPVNQLTFISDETELVEIFGKPNANNYTEWFSIVSLFSYNIVVGVIRPTDSSTALITANATLTGYDNTLQLSGTVDYYNQDNIYKFAARTPTNKYNGYKIKAIDHGADQILTITEAILNNTIIGVVSATGLLVNDYIQIGTEYLRVSAINTNNLTVSRGQLGSANTSTYTNGTIVTKVNYADSVVSSDIVPLNVPSGNLTTATTTITLSAAIPNTYVAGAYLKIKRVPVGGTATSEIVRIVSVNTGNNTIVIQRAQLGDTALAFSVTTIGVESSVVVSTTLVDFSLSTTTTTLSSAFPSYSIPTFTGITGDIVSTPGKYGWVYAVTSNTITVLNADSTKKFKTGDVLYNSDGVTVIGTVGLVEEYYTKQYIVPGIPWSSIAPQPGTSIYAAQNGAKFDEMHLVVVDNANNIIERYPYLSKGSDALTAEGTNVYWKSIINNRSTIVFGGVEDFTTGSTLTLEIPDNTTYINAALNAPIVNKLYSVFKSTATTSTIETTIIGGTSYDFNSPSVINAVLDAGYDLVADAESFADIDMLIPGKITAQRVNKLINIVNNRKDCRVCVSPLYSDVVNSNSTTIKTQNIKNFFDTIPSTSYAIFDSGYKYVYDKYNNTYYWIPCAADVAGLTLSTENPWTSPAGTNKGILKNAIKLAYSPKKSERDILFSARINPITNFPGTGIVLYGDKTALSSPSAFGQIGVRGLFITIEKIIGKYADNTLFEFNDEVTRDGFTALVRTYLNGIVAARGIKEFMVVADESNNTPTTIDEQKFFCDIYIKPNRSINFIVLTFIAQPSGVSFTEAAA